MKILVLNGSPHPQGSTKDMVNAFKKGAESAGHIVDVVDVCKKKIGGCLACEYCHSKGHGECIQKDDMQEVYNLLKEAEMLVIASPIYYHGISGQLKCVIDRFYSAAYPRGPKNLKKVAMILSSGDANMYEGALFSFKGDFLDYLGLENMGVFTAHAHLFTEVSPPIPQEYENHFCVHGTLLPGYTVEGKEPVKAAADLSDGGISMPEKPEKASVLGKLSAAKTQDKAVPHAGAPAKKKEEMNR